MTGKIIRPNLKENPRAHNCKNYLPHRLDCDYKTMAQCDCGRWWYLGEDFLAGYKVWRRVKPWHAIKRARIAQEEETNDTDV